MKKLLSILIVLISLNAWAGWGNSNPRNITVESITSSEAVPITSYYSPLKTDTVVAGAVTVDWDDSNAHYIVLASGANTITLTNPKSLGRYVLILKQPASGGAGTVTFSPVPYVSGGTLPTLTATNSAVDVIPIIYIGGLNKYVISSLLDVK